VVQVPRKFYHRIEAHFSVSAGTSEFLAIAAVVLPLTVLTIIGGELVPKVFALRNKEWVSLMLSPAMYGFSFGVWPAVWFFETSVNWLTAHAQRLVGPESHENSSSPTLRELQAVVGLARASRLIGQQEERIILNAPQLFTRPAREIMLPSEHMNMIPADSSISDALIGAHRDMHTRYPVTERSGDPQAIVGYASFKDIVAVMRLSREPSLRSIIRPLLTFRDRTPVSRCLEDMIRSRSHIALISDQQQQVIGMITLEDIVEELVGEIEDEHDRLTVRAHPSAGDWVVSGGIPIKRLRELTGVELDISSTTPTTLNEWVTQRLGRLPTAGDVIQAEDIEVSVRRTRRGQVFEAFIHVPKALENL
jgi:putative hemolysin